MWRCWSDEDRGCRPLLAAGFDFFGASFFLERPDRNQLSSSSRLCAQMYSCLRRRSSLLPGNPGPLGGCNYFVPEGNPSLSFRAHCGGLRPWPTCGSRQPQGGLGGRWAQRGPQGQGLGPGHTQAVSPGYLQLLFWGPGPWGRGFGLSWPTRAFLLLRCLDLTWPGSPSIPGVHHLLQILIAGPVSVRTPDKVRNPRAPAGRGAGEGVISIAVLCHRVRSGPSTGSSTLLGAHLLWGHLPRPS